MRKFIVLGLMLLCSCGQLKQVNQVNGITKLEGVTLYIYKYKQDSALWVIQGYKVKYIYRDNKLIRINK